MGTQNMRVGGFAGNMQPGAIGRRAASVTTKYLQVDSDATTIPINEVLQLFDVPANSLVTLIPHVEVAEGGVATANIGWTEAATGFASALNLNAATTNASPAAPVTKFFAAATIITMTVLAEIDAAKIGFYVSVTTL